MKEPKPESILAAQLMHECHAPRAVHCDTYRCARDAMRLCDLANRATTLAARQCNGVPRFNAKAGRVFNSWTETDQASCDRSLAKIEKAANEILALYGAKVLTVHGDPRGCVMRIALASGATNGMGEGWGL